MEDFNIYSQFYPGRKVKFSNPPCRLIWCYYKATVFALEHPGGGVNHQSNDALLHLIEQTSKYDLSLQLVRTYVHLVLKIQNHLYVNTLTLYQHSQICEVTVCFETVSIEKKIYMKLTFPSTRSKIGSKIIGVMTMVKRFRTLNTRLRMFRHPFLDGRRSDGADAMTVYRDTLKFDQRMLTLKKKPAICLPSQGILSVLCLLFSYLRRGWKLSVVVLGKFIIQTLWFKCHM